VIGGGRYRHRIASARPCGRAVGASPRSRFCPSLPWTGRRTILARMAESLQDGLWPGGSCARFGADPRVYPQHGKAVHRGQRRTREGTHHRPDQVEKNDKGQFVPKEQAGTEQTRPAQLVLLAMGFLGPEQAMLKDLKVETDARSNIKADSRSTRRASRASFCCWRLPAAAEPRRLGRLNVRPRARPRMRPYLMGCADLP